MGLKRLKYVELDDTNGTLYAAGVPYLLLPTTVVKSIDNVLRRIAGDAAAETLIYQIGEDIGKEYVRRINKILEGTDVELDREMFLEQVYCTTMQSGWGNFEIEKLSLKKHQIEIHVNNTPSQRLLKKTDCSLERGILAGAYYEIVGKKIYYFLSEKTEKAATFVSLKKIPKEVLTDEKLALLSKGELEEIVDERTRDLEQSKDFTESVISSMLDVVVVTDLGDHIVKVNDAVVKLLGYGMDELIGEPSSKIVAKRDVKRNEECTRQTLEKGFVWNFKSTWVTKNKEDIPVSCNRSVLKDAQGNVIGVLCVTRDMREMKELKNLIVGLTRVVWTKTKNKDLEKEVREMLEKYEKQMK